MAQGTVDSIHSSVCLEMGKGNVGVGGVGLTEEEGIDGTKVRGRIERSICADEGWASVCLQCCGSAADECELYAPSSIFIRTLQFDIRKKAQLKNPIQLCIIELSVSPVIIDSNTIYQHPFSYRHSLCHQSSRV